MWRKFLWWIECRYKRQTSSVETENNTEFLSLVLTTSLFLSLLNYNKESIEFISRICCNPWQQMLSKCEMCSDVFEPYKLPIYLQNMDSVWFEIVYLLKMDLFQMNLFQWFNSPSRSVQPQLSDIPDVRPDVLFSRLPAAESWYLSRHPHSLHAYSFC